MKFSKKFQKKISVLTALKTTSDKCEQNRNTVIQSKNYCPQYRHVTWGISRYVNSLWNLYVPCLKSKINIRQQIKIILNQ